MVCTSNMSRIRTFKHQLALDRGHVLDPRRTRGEICDPALAAG